MLQLDMKSCLKGRSVKFDTDVPALKIYPQINATTGPNNCPNIKFRIILTWQSVLGISVIVVPG